MPSVGTTSAAAEDMPTPVGGSAGEEAEFDRVLGECRRGMRAQDVGGTPRCRKPSVPALSKRSAATSRHHAVPTSWVSLGSLSAVAEEVCEVAYGGV